MAEPFIAEIRIFSFSFPPKGWAFCNGQFLAIGTNQALFSLLGTTFGGNGQTTFALPDNRSRAPLHAGSGHDLGERGGEKLHTLTIGEMPTHTHLLGAHTTATTENNSTSTNGTLLASSLPNNIFSEYGSGSLVTLHAGSVEVVGNSVAHNNMQPYLALNFCIAMAGFFPSPI